MGVYNGSPNVHTDPYRFHANPACAMKQWIVMLISGGLNQKLMHTIC